MGNASSQENEEEKEEEDNNNYNNSKKSKFQEKVQIIPYSDGMPVLQSKLQKLIKKNEDSVVVDNEVLVMKENKEKIIDIQEEIAQMERTNFPTFYEHIRQEYQSFSQENKMGQRKLLEYFGLQDLEHQQLGTRFFLACKSTQSEDKTGPYLDYSKFLKTLALLSGNNEKGRLQFLYQLFDLNLDGKIERDAMRAMIQMILDALLSVSYEDDDLKLLSRKIKGEQERVINQALDQILQEIFEGSNQSINFSKWREWIESIDGFKELLAYDPQTGVVSEELIEEQD